MSGPAHAQGDICSAPAVRDAIVKGLAKVRDTDGNPVSSYASITLSGTPTTISATPTKLVCRVRLTISVGGESRTLRGRVTYERFPGGKSSAKIEFE